MNELSESPVRAARSFRVLHEWAVIKWRPGFIHACGRPVRLHGGVYPRRV